MTTPETGAAVKAWVLDAMRYTVSTVDGFTGPPPWWQSHIDEARAVLAPCVVLTAEEAEKGAAFQEEALAICRQHGFVFEDIGNEPGNWQHLAFTFYTMLCEVRALLTPERGE